MRAGSTELLQPAQACTWNNDQQTACNQHTEHHTTHQAIQLQQGRATDLACCLDETKHSHSNTPSQTALLQRTQHNSGQKLSPWLFQNGVGHGSNPVKQQGLLDVEIAACSPKACCTDLPHFTRNKLCRIPTAPDQYQQHYCKHAGPHSQLSHSMLMLTQRTPEKTTPVHARIYTHHRPKPHNKNLLQYKPPTETEAHHSLHSQHTPTDLRTAVHTIAP